MMDPRTALRAAEDDEIFIFFLGSLMHPTRAQIVQAARGWLGTRFVHQGRLKKTAQHQGGCDCLGLLVGVAKELRAMTIRAGRPTYLAECDCADYGRIPDGAQLKEALNDLLETIPLTALAPGDVILLAMDGNPQHLAMISDYPGGTLGMIHAFLPARKVVEHRLDDVWRKRIIASYRLPVSENRRDTVLIPI